MSMHFLFYFSIHDLKFAKVIYHDSLINLNLSFYNTIFVIMIVWNLTNLKVLT